MASLITFLADRAGRPFVWGHDDCCLFLADWWMACHGTDPAAPLRGTYDSRPPRVGRLVLACVARSGTRSVATPSVGDFGLLRIDGVLTGAIMSPSGWAIRSALGVGFLPADIKAVRAWAI